jgi:hypothetical protein
MSIADTYRSMSEDVRRLAHETESEAVRDAYLALAELWRERSTRSESGVVLTRPTHQGQSRSPAVAVVADK